MISSIQRKNQDNKVINKHGYGRIQKILDKIETSERYRVEEEDAQAVMEEDRKNKHKNKLKSMEERNMMTVNK